MPNLWDKTPEAPSPSDLNPLTNPVLERNLGRWAKVYFGNPPEKREQAVSNLLEQIKRESGSGAAAQPARGSENPAGGYYGGRRELRLFGCAGFARKG